MRLPMSKLNVFTLNNTVVNELTHLLHNIHGINFSWSFSTPQWKFG